MLKIKNNKTKTQKNLNRMLVKINSNNNLIKQHTMSKIYVNMSI